MTPCQTLCQCVLLSTWSRAGVKLHLVQVSLKGGKKGFVVLETNRSMQVYTDKRIFRRIRDIVR